MISWAPPAQAVKRRGESSPGWLYHHLTISGPAGTMDEITAAARGNLVLGQGKFSGQSRSAPGQPQVNPSTDNKGIPAVPVS